MIPLRDANPSRIVPFVSYLIIAACVLVFFYEISLGSAALKQLMMQGGLVPVKYSGFDNFARAGIRGGLLPFFTTMFLHGGWLHLIGNMWVLYIFGDNVESALGHSRYFFFYILCGLIAGAIQVITNLHSHIPTIGASGAIAGVMGAYFILYPKAKILTLIPIFFFFSLLEIPAYVFLGLWFALQFFSGAFSLVGGGQEYSGVAWWAHVGGFVAGVSLLFLMRSRRVRHD